MNALETLLSRRWIVKSRDRDLYYQVKDELGKVKKFLTEKLGYQVIVNPYLIKVEKMPAKAQPWMGIQDFTDQMEYVFFCLILMFLEDREVEEQFVLSELTEYIQGQHRETQIDWTLYSHRRHLIKVLKFCVSSGILDVNDGNEDNFAKDVGSEVLYENTGASRYFMKNFTQDIMDYQSPEDFMKAEWIGIDEDRGIVRRQRVYRSLLMTMGLYRTEETEEDFVYLRNYRNMIRGELSELLDCELQLYRTSAFLVLGEDCKMGRCFPETNTLSDIVLLCNGVIRELLEEGKLAVSPREEVRISKEDFRWILEICKEHHGEGWSKLYRELSLGELYQEVTSYMKSLEFLREENSELVLQAIVGKATGHYMREFEQEKERRDPKKKTEKKKEKKKK